MVTEDKESSSVHNESSPEKSGTGPGASQTILSRKMRKILDSQLETDFETQEALKELSSFFTENTLKNRRYLRGEIERRSLQINLDFLESFGKVKSALESVRNEVTAINASCVVMKNQLDATKSSNESITCFHEF